MNALLPTLALLAATALPLAHAQSAPEPANALGGTQSSQWRAASRLGYGPGPHDDAGGMGNAKEWALGQLQLAAAASQKPAQIPKEMSGFAVPMPELFTGYRNEREALRAQPPAVPLREQAAAARAAQMAAAEGAGGEMGTAQQAMPGAAAAGATGDNNQAFSRDMARKAASWRLLACSRADLENPLLARMTEFWFNHLNVFAGKGPVRPFVGHYVVHAIRPHALGRFEDLLLASARHPAMLFYLDQAQSVAEGGPAPPMAGDVRPNQPRGLNENYARELLELHTLGANGGYTQTDVRELARVLTGWTVGPQTSDGFRFAPRMHDRNEKVVLGQRLRASALASGITEGESVIRMLARHPSTAQRVALRLAQFFVADQPSPALVQRLAARFTATQGDISAVLQTLIESGEFWQQDNQLFKTPFDYACSVLTAIGGPKERADYAASLLFLAAAGQPVHGWATPDGYKTDAATWLVPEALSRRADFALALGRRVKDPSPLQAWLTPVSRERVSRESASLQAGLSLAAPEFMFK